MGKLTLEIQEDNFNKKTTSEYDLSILTGVDSLVYCISDPHQNILALTNYAFDKEVKDFSQLAGPLAQLLSSEKQLQYPYRKVKLALLNTAFTMVPNSLYDERQKASYLDKMLPLTEKDLIKVDDLEPLEAQNVYLVDKKVNNILRGHFPGGNFYHANTPLLLGLKKVSASRAGQSVFANVKNRLVQLFYFDGHELVFSNCFSFISSKDFIYYTMNVFHQFNLKPDAVPFILSGQVVKDSEIYHLLYRYIKHLQIIRIPDEYQIGQRMSGIPTYFYFDLFSLSLCE